MGSASATYWPTSLLSSFRIWPVLVFVTVMFAFGTTAPELSVTVPTMVACCATAEAAKTPKNRNNIAKRRELLVCAKAIKPSKYLGKNVIASLPTKFSAAIFSLRLQLYEYLQRANLSHPENCVNDFFIGPSSFSYFVTATCSFVTVSAAFATRMKLVAVSTTYSFSNQRKGQPSFNSGKSGCTMVTPGITPPGMNV